MTDVPPEGVRSRTMTETIRPLLIFAAVLGGWFVLNRWVLPRLGVPT